MTFHLEWCLTYLSTHPKLTLCSLVILNKYIKFLTLLPPSFNSPYSPTDSSCNLGFISYLSLTLSKQILSLSNACNYHIRDLRLIRHTLDLATASVIAISLVHSKLDYCNSIHLYLPQKQISHLQLLQNSLAQAVTGTTKTEHITSILKSLHWLKIEECIH